MALFIKRSNAFRMRNAEYRPWNMRDVIENFGEGKTYDEVVEEQRKKREETKR